MTFFVYGIFDSSDWGIAKYVGAASRLSRPLKHERDSRNLKNQAYKHRGIRSLICDGHHVGSSAERSRRWREREQARLLREEQGVGFPCKPLGVLADFW